MPANSWCDRMEWKAAQREIEMSDTEAHYSITMKEHTMLLMVISAKKYAPRLILFECLSVCVSNVSYTKTPFPTNSFLFLSQLTSGVSLSR